MASNKIVFEISWQVTIPLGNVRGMPISVSLLARYGGDIFLLESLMKLNPKLQLEVDVRDSRHLQSLVHSECV